MRMTWASLAFFHWRVPVATLRPLIPAGLSIDEFDGSAWIGLVPFTMYGVRHLWSPPIPTMHAFHECNVRTYVTAGDEPGVWFFSLDAVSRLAVWGARTFWNLPYRNARIDLREDGDRIEYDVDRTEGSCPTGRYRWSVGDRLPGSAPGSLEWFLTERYCMYAQTRRGELRRGRIWHDPWPLRRAQVESLEDELVTAAGVDVAGVPDAVHGSDPITVEAWALAPVGLGGRDKIRRKPPNPS